MSTRPTGALALMSQQHEVVHVILNKLLSEAALAEDWNRPEEDEAWQHLQEVQ